MVEFMTETYVRLTPEWAPIFIILAMYKHAALTRSQRAIHRIENCLVMLPGTAIVDWKQQKTNTRLVGEHSRLHGILWSH